MIVEYLVCNCCTRAGQARIGDYRLRARISLARSIPLISGMVWSVMTRSNRDGSAVKSARASLLFLLGVA
jgi:hypothetical protein